jgi:hypothetical protein
MYYRQSFFGVTGELFDAKQGSFGARRGKLPS